MGRLMLTYLYNCALMRQETVARLLQMPSKVHTYTCQITIELKSFNFHLSAEAADARLSLHHRQRETG